MLTAETVKKMKLGIQPINDKVCMLIESGLLWVNSNTKLKINIDDEKALEKLPANIRLFLCRYMDIMKLRPGITSESISNLSQSFKTDTKDLLWEAAEELLGDEIKSGVTFVQATERWRY